MASPQVILIAGATGLVGFPSAQAFLKSGKYEVRILVQSSTLKDDTKAKKVQDLQAKGAKIVEADLTDVESLKKALQGVHTVLSTLASEGLGLQSRLLTAAKASGVTRFVPSEFGVDHTKLDLKVFPLFNTKKSLRQEIESSGLEWTYIITGGFYETSFLPWNGLDAANLKVTVIGDGNTPWAVGSVEDFTQVLPEVLSNPKSKNATVNLFGQYLTWNQAIELYEKKLGKKFERTTLSPSSVIEQIKASPAAWALQIQYAFATGSANPDTQDQSQYSNHKFQTLAEWLQKQQ